MRITEIERINVKNKRLYLEIFEKLLKEIRLKKFDFKDSKNEDYLIVNEERLNSHFVHLVPRELESVFYEIKKNNPDTFLGFTILVGKTEGTDVRLSCFGLPCSELTKVILK